MAKTRQHNEYFRTVSLGGRKSCPCCKAKLENNESIWSWGNYVRAKWVTVTHFCNNCFESNVQKPLTSHTDDCGCTVNLVGYSGRLPNWLHLNCPVPVPVPQKIAA